MLHFHAGRSSFKPRCKMQDMPEIQARFADLARRSDEKLADSLSESRKKMLEFSSRSFTRGTEFVSRPVCPKCVMALVHYLTHDKDKIDLKSFTGFFGEGKKLSDSYAAVMRPIYVSAVFDYSIKRVSAKASSIIHSGVYSQIVGVDNDMGCQYAYEYWCQDPQSNWRGSLADVYELLEFEERTRYVWDEMTDAGRTVLIATLMTISNLASVVYKQDVRLVKLFKENAHKLLRAPGCSDADQPELQHRRLLRRLYDSAPLLDFRNRFCRMVASENKIRNGSGSNNEQGDASLPRDDAPSDAEAAVPHDDCSRPEMPAAQAKTADPQPHARIEVVESTGGLSTFVFSSAEDVLKDECHDVSADVLLQASPRASTQTDRVGIDDIAGRPADGNAESIEVGEVGDTSTAEAASPEALPRRVTIRRMCDKIKNFGLNALNKIRVAFWSCTTVQEV
nr:hypothetical protein HK105_000257 [Polyrhizophydium stewartii]